MCVCVCECVCVCVCVAHVYFVCFFIVLEETHLFDETRPHSSKNIQGLFCDSHPASKDLLEQLDWTDAQIVCWGECRDESCGKGPKKSCFTLK